MQPLYMQLSHQDIIQQFHKIFSFNNYKFYHNKTNDKLNELQDSGILDNAQLQNEVDPSSSPSVYLLMDELQLQMTHYQCWSLSSQKEEEHHRLEEWYSPGHIKLSIQYILFWFCSDEIEMSTYHVVFRHHRCASVDVC